MYKETVDADTVLITMGERGDKMYVLKAGKVKFKGKDFEHIENRQIVFGEFAILYNCKRMATVTTVTRTELWTLENAVFQKIIKEFNKEEHKEKVEFLRQIESFKEIGDEELDMGAHYLETVFYECDTVIIKEGGNVNKLYIITAGAVAITKEGQGNINQKNLTTTISNEFIYRRNWAVYKRSTFWSFRCHRRKL